MTILRILPGAAGLIALTATIGFVDGRRESEAESISRNRITPVMASANMATSSLHSTQLSINERPAYLVEFRRKDTYEKILIDAENGQLLLRLKEG